jgi:hypothetical protein
MLKYNILLHNTERCALQDDLQTSPLNELGHNNDGYKNVEAPAEASLTRSPGEVR